MKIDHLKCQVICGGEVLAEYQEKDDGQRARSCHIVSEAGRSFVLRTQSDPHKFDVIFHLWIDGQRFDKVIIQGSKEFNVQGAPVDLSTVRPFRFANIVLTDDDRALQDSSPNTKDLGTICIKYYRIRDVQRTVSYKPPSCDVENRPVHERAKKAGGHRVTLGEVAPAPTTQSSRCTYIDPVHSPYYTFTWRYRSKDILQAQGIMPPDPPPQVPKRPGPFTPSGGNSSKRRRTEQLSSQSGSSSQVKLEDMPTAQEIQARREALRAQRAALEAQEAAFEEELRQVDAAGLKREVSPIVLGGGSGEVIDLTEDD